MLRRSGNSKPRRVKMPIGTMGLGLAPRDQTCQWSHPPVGAMYMAGGIQERTCAEEHHLRFTTTNISHSHPSHGSVLVLRLAQGWINPDLLQIRNRFPCMQNKWWGTPMVRDRVRASTHRQFFPWKELIAKLEIEWECPLGARQRPFVTGTSLQLQMRRSTHLPTESDAEQQWQEGKSRLVMKLVLTEICSPWLQAANGSQSRQAGGDASQPLPRCPCRSALFMGSSGTNVFLAPSMQQKLIWNYSWNIKDSHLSLAASSPIGAWQLQ